MINEIEKLPSMWKPIISNDKNTPDPGYERIHNWELLCWNKLNECIDKLNIIIRLINEAQER